MENELKDLEKQIEERKMQLEKIDNKNSLSNIFSKKEDKNIKEEPKKDFGGELVEQAFGQAVIHQVQTNENLQAKMLKTAETYTNTKMQTIETDVDTEHKKSIFNNKKDACESYGFNEDTTPIWAIKFMNVGYSIMLAIWLFIGSFTFMPVIFIMKKINVGLKNTWVAILIAILLYLLVTIGIPLIAPLILSIQG